MKSYIVAYSTRQSLDPYKDPGIDRWEVFQGENALKEAHKRYNQLFNRKDVWTANVCEILTSTEAYEGVKHENDTQE